MPEHSAESSQKQAGESAVCDVCGRFGAVEFGDRLVCTDCYQGSGSCCAECEREE